MCVVNYRVYRKVGKVTEEKTTKLSKVRKRKSKKVTSDLPTFICERSGELFAVTGLDMGKELPVSMRFFSSDELQSDHEENEELRCVRLVHIDAIYVDEATNVRNVRRDTPEFFELTDSISKHGVLEPVLVRRTWHHQPMHYELITGFRRYSASQDAGELLIPVRVLTNDMSKKAVQIVENMCRKDLDPLEAAMALYELRSKGKRKKNGKRALISLAELTELTGIHTSKVSDLIAIAKGVNKTVIEAYDARKISYAKLALLAKMPKDEQKKLLDTAIKDSITELRKACRNRREALNINKAGRPANKHALERGGRQFKTRSIAELLDCLASLENIIVNDNTNDVVKVQCAMLQYVLSELNSYTDDPVLPNTSVDEALTD